MTYLERQQLRELGWDVASSHWARQCHPETCCCSTDYVVTYNGTIQERVETKEDGWDRVQRILELQQENARLRARNAELKAQLST